MKRLSSSSREVAEAIRDRVPFMTHGALKAGGVVGTGSWDSGQLRGADLDQFRLDMDRIDYVVWSYSTPIAWHVTGPNTDRWWKVTQKFSVTTTSKHQGKLYLIETGADQ